MIGLSLRQLEVFVAVASSGSIRAAAERINLSQPATSMALGELERQLAAPLFDRVRGRLYLNERGRDTLPLARDVLDRVGELQQRAAGRSLLLAGELRLGASNTVGNYLVGDLLGGFTSSHPQVSVKLTVDNTDAIIAGILDRALDVGCVEGLIADPGIEQRPWREDALAICVRADHPLARRRRLRPTDFAGARWILRERGSGTRALSERALAGLPPGAAVLELGQSEAIKQAVMAGLGIAFLPQVAVADAVAAGRLVALKTPFLDLRRRMSWVARRSSYRGAVLGAFLDSVGFAGDAADAVTPQSRSRAKARRNTRASGAAARKPNRHG